MRLNNATLVRVNGQPAAWVRVNDTVAWSGAPTEPGVPTITSITEPSPGVVRIEWTAVDGATEYRIYETNSAATGPAAVILAPTTSRQSGAIWDPGETPDYWVTAVVGGVESDPSNVATITIATPEEPPTTGDDYLPAMPADWGANGITQVSASGASNNFTTAGDYEITVPAGRTPNTYGFWVPSNAPAGVRIWFKGGVIDTGTATNVIAPFFINADGAEYVRIENLHIKGTDNRDGIRIQMGRLGSRLDIGNVKVDRLYGTQAGAHADVIQTWRGPDELHIRNVQGVSDYQGFMLNPFDQSSAHQADPTRLKTWTIKNVWIDMPVQPVSGEAGTPFYSIHDAATQLPVIETANLYVTTKDPTPVPNISSGRPGVWAGVINAAPPGGTVLLPPLTGDPEPVTFTHGSELTAQNIGWRGAGLNEANLIELPTSVVDGYPAYTISTGGTPENPRIIENFNLTGGFRITNGVSNVIIRRGRIRGHNTDLNVGVPWLVRQLGTATENILVENVELAVEPTYQTWKNSYAIQGRAVKVRRCEIRGTVDGYAPSAISGVNGDCDIEESWIHGLVHYNNPPDTTHADGSHSDGVQPGGGFRTAARVVRCKIGAAYTSGILWTKDASSAYGQAPQVIDNHFYIEDTRTGGCLNFKIANGSFGPAQVTGNVFDMTNNPNNRAAIVASNAAITATTWQGNVDHNGNPVRVWNGSQLVTV